MLEHVVARMRRRLSSLIESFVPRGVAADPLSSKQARMFVISHLMGPILGNSVPIALWALDQTPGWDIAVVAAAITSFWLFPFALRWGVSFNALVMLSILVDWFVILWSAYFYGGMASPTMVWILIIPILAIFYIGGERTLLPWLTSMSVLCFAAFAGACMLLDPLANDIPPGPLTALGIVSTAGVLAYVAGMSVYYAKIFDAGVDLETEVKRREAMATELRDAVRQAERATAAKSEFLARMSHELRNPLNAIIGYGGLLKEDAEESRDEAVLRDVERILDAGRYLVRLIDLILDLSKIEAGRMRFDVTPQRVEELVRDAVERHRAQIEAAGNRVELDLSGDLGEVCVDRVRVAQVLGDLLCNAAQHTQGGVVTVSAHRKGDEFTIAVADTGAGIAPEILATVFESFSMAREAAGGRYGGTGLSLTVGQRLCRAMGGVIEVVSALDKGSEFTIRLPAAQRSMEAVVSGHAPA